MLICPRIRAQAQALREQLALAAGLSRADAGLVQLAVRAARRAASSVAVDVTINLPDAAAAARAKTALTSDAINSAARSAGLPPVTVTAPPSVSSGIPAAGAAVEAGMGWTLLVTLAAATAVGRG